MSRFINVNSVSQEDLKEMDEKLNITLPQTKYNKFAPQKSIQLFRLENNIVYFPFCYNKKFKRPESSLFPKREIKFDLQLRPEQKTLASEAVSLLNKNSSVIVSAYTGFGKTYTAIYLASIIKLKTLIVCHRCVLMKQWEESIKACSATSEHNTFQILTPKSKIKDCDFYIVNAINVAKFPQEFLKTIGFLVIDECHVIMAETLSKCMLYVFPRFVLALSATPYREDGLNILFNLYFGEDKIIRKMFRDHLVYQVLSGFVPEVELASNGRINWSSVLESQAKSIERNELIIKILKRFPDRVFLVLCKRISQAEYLMKRLNEEKEDVTDLFGTKQEFNRQSRILIGTTGKCSTGFDHAKLDTLLLASDLEQYFIQALGRIFRTKGGETIPLVIDIVDEHPILKKHWMTRKDVYLEHGGKIKKLDV